MREADELWFVHLAALALAVRMSAGSFSNIDMLWLLYQYVVNMKKVWKSDKGGAFSGGYCGS